MITLRVTADVKDDRRVTLTLPPEVPTGKADLVLMVQPHGSEQAKLSGTSLADWAEENAEDWDDVSSEDVEGFTGRRF